MKAPQEEFGTTFTERKPIKGYEGFYSITEDGRVWSEARVVTTFNGFKRKAGSIWLTPFDLGDGYLRVNLRMPGHIRMHCIHWLVARNFLPKPPKGLEIDHKDRNSKNNHISNLRYVTKTKNVLNKEAKGCYYVPRKNRWQARLGLGNKKIQIGYFKTEEEARAAYVAAKEAILLTLK